MPYSAGHILLNKYRIESSIGQGAFGEVYLATHLGLNAPRALKILRRDAPGIGSSEYADFRARFQLEAQLGAQLDHPNIIRVHDFEQDKKTLILAMEYAAGGSLEGRIVQARQGGQPIPVTEALQIARDVAQGLAAIHALDAVHRDLKPSNILFDKSGRAKMADLGLAQIHGGPSLRSKLSQARPHPGTPGYMSPEQERTSAYLTPASDVYALGVVLFEMLTGRAWRNQRPGTRLRSLRADLPQWLDDLLASLLAEEPKNRPWDGAEAAGMLQEGMEREKRRLEEEAAIREAEEKARREAEEHTRLAAETRARREADERARQEAEAKARREAKEKAQRQAQEREARRAAAPYQARLPKSRRSVTSWLLPMATALIFFLFLLAIWPGFHTGAPTATPEGPNTVTPMQPLPALPTTVTPAPSFTPAITLTPTLGSGSTWTRPADGMVMVYVPAGNFMMGSSDSDSRAASDEKPQHTVYLDAYWIDQTEVTNAMFQKFVQATGYKTDAEKAGWSWVWDGSTWNQVNGADWNHPKGPNTGLDGLGDYPVVQVSWNDANSYCRWAGARLPTEAEWEKAARGTDGRIYPWGNDAPTCSLANYWPSSSSNGCVGDTQAVGSYPSGASPYGALDMAGNVWEWVADWYSDTYYAISPSSNPPGPSSGQYRVLRGGSWGGSGGSVRSAFRYWDDPADAGSSVGFRCSRSP